MREVHGAELLWAWSRQLHRRGFPLLATAVKSLNFFTFHCLLPYQAEVGADVRLGHHGMGVVIHPNTSIGDRVYIWHHVTLAAETLPGSDVRLRIEDDVTIGVGAVVIARTGQGLTVGRGAQIGAGAVVTRDVPPGATVVGPRARELA